MPCGTPLIPGTNKNAEEAINVKNALIYQSSEYDCGPTCLLNAVRFLFEREEILPDVLKHIWLMGNDTYCENGCVGCHGTSRAAMRYMGAWFREYGKGCGFPVDAEFRSREEARVAPGTPAWQCLERGGCVVMRCFAGHIPHYVLLTALLDQDEIGLFDPYEEEPDFQGPGRRVIRSAPRRMNRAVQYALLNLETDADYAMGPLDTRETLLIWRTDQDPEKEKP